MAQKGVELDRESFSCSICLDLLKDPVSLTCGHNYCMHCIKGHWDTEVRGGGGGGGVHAYSCPQCRQTFRKRPVLKKNTMLAGLVEQLKKTGVQAAPAEPCYARSEDVACDSCSGRKLKGLKSCLQCMASFCGQHLQPHYDSPAFKKHKLVEPSKKLQENFCSRHDEVLKVFCRTDRQLICLLCVMDQHKGHDTVPAAKERSERQKELEASRRNIHRGIEDRERDVKKLQEEVEAINESADRAVQHSEKTFAEMVNSIQKRSSEVKKQLRSKQETEVRRVKELQKKMQEEISALKRRDDGLKQLALTEDHNQFLQSFPSLSTPHSDYKHSSSFDTRAPRHFEDVTKAVSAARDKLHAVLTQTWTNISRSVTEVEVLLPQPQPKTRADFLRYSRDITLDPNTADNYLVLSHGNRKATGMDEQQSYPDHPDRFTDIAQVLSAESVTGRGYWEVERSGDGVSVAVTYKNISRAGEESLFGWNDKSWALECVSDRYIFRYNSVETPVPGPLSSRIGVYVDHREGSLSFYSISDDKTMTLLHRVQTSLTQPLYAGVWVNDVASAEFVTLRAYFHLMKKMWFEGSDRNMQM